MKKLIAAVIAMMFMVGCGDMTEPVEPEPLTLEDYEQMSDEELWNTRPYSWLEESEVFEIKFVSGQTNKKIESKIKFMSCVTYFPGYVPGTVYVVDSSLHDSPALFNTWFEDGTFFDSVNDGDPNANYTLYCLSNSI